MEEDSTTRNKPDPDQSRCMAVILEHTSMMAVLLDRQFNFICVNRAYAETCRHEPSFFRGKNHFDLYPHQENQAIFQRVVDTGQPFYVAAKPFVFPDQPERGVTYWDWSLIPVKDGDSYVTSLVFTLAEVTDRVRAESQKISAVEALKKSEEKFRTLHEFAPIAIVFNRLDNGQFLESNRALWEMTGYSEEEIRSLTYWDITPIEYKDQEAKQLESLHTLGRYGPYEKEYIRKGGVRFPVLLCGVRMKDPDGTDLIYSVVQDISELKVKEKALRLSESLLRKAESIARVGSWELDVEANRLTWSDEVYRIFGLQPQQFEATYESFMESVHPDDRELVGKAYQSSLKENMGGYAVEHRIVRRDNNEICYVHEKCEHIRNDAGKIIRSVGMVQDITERKLAEQEKDRLQAQLQQSQKMESVGRLAGGIAHDFNNLLGVILGQTEMALMEIDSSDPHYASFKEIQRAGERSADLIRQLLAFARKQTASPKVLALNDALSSILTVVGRLIGEDINLHWKPGADLWAVKIDPVQLDQVVANLCVNSRDAISGVGNITIETGNIVVDEALCRKHPSFVPGEYVTLTVTDDGCGLDQAAMDHLFEPFFTTKKMGKGTGLGLATIYGIVRQNQGFINVISEPGQGASFAVYLPRFRGRAEEKLHDSPEKIEGGGIETVLLVEDEKALLEMGKTMLEKLGYQTITASSPGDAIKAAQDHAGKIHLLVTDVIMPEMNGLDLANKLSSMNPDLKILFMSGYPADVIAHRGLIEEGMPFIQKPFSMKDLTSGVRKALGNSGQK